MATGPLSEQAMEIAEAITKILSESARVLFPTASVGETLSRVVELAVAQIGGCDSASLVVIEAETAVPLVRSADVPNIWLSRIDEGPLGEALQHNRAVYAGDLQVEDRWPTFTPSAVETGLRGVVALPLMLRDQPAVLTLYARCPDAFGVIDRREAEMVALLASLSLSVAFAHEEENRRIENLESALQSREIIGQAEGILMERERISAGQAFDILRRASQRLNVKLREVARNLVETGERPETTRFTGPDERTESLA